MLVKLESKGLQNNDWWLKHLLSLMAKAVKPCPSEIRKTSTVIKTRATMAGRSTQLLGLAIARGGWIIKCR